ncbi:FadR family transcriptional regulator [Alkalicaulis satelles]|uniref:FadR family transcriptional regulator n=1 Tax=Alkalicaulis satelles TaxID=2609175 RepID=A0A5M6ZP90_9PROT|nr:FadR/GntR family transcriptional regulator [Alkalicaulis satelles]KAA5805048.1 FadR family transcriptional regulator [Alkalicaulis satelles]
MAARRRDVLAAMAPAERPLTRIHGTIAHDLGVAIVSGRYKPGETLPTEIEFSEQLKVSRSAYREAVRTLAAKGLVESRPKTGTRIAEQYRWNLLDPDVLAWFFEAEPLPKLVEGLFELRLIVEPAAAALAAERRDSRHLTRMREALMRMERHTVTTAAGRDADREFHAIILEATGNPPLLCLASTIGAGVHWTTVYKARKDELPADPMPQHWKVFDAIAAGGPEEARAAMEVLVRGALRDTSRALKRAAPARQGKRPGAA